MHSDIHDELVRRIRDLSHPIKPLPTGQTEQLTHLENIEAVLFDVYGTLFLSGSGDISLASPTNNVTAMEETLAAVEFKGRLRKAAERGTDLFLKNIEDSHAKRRQAGVAYPEVEIQHIWQSVLRRLGKEGLLEGTVTPKCISRLAVEYECRVNPAWPMPGAEDVLAALREKGKKLGIVSNAQFYTPLLFEAFFQKSLGELGFDPDLCAWSYQALEAKPSMRLFEGPIKHLQEKMGIAPKQLLYVGNDLLNDMLPAFQLGCKTCLFAGDARSLRLREGDERCVSLAPDLIIKNLDHLVEVV